MDDQQAMILDKLRAFYTKIQEYEKILSFRRGRSYTETPAVNIREMADDLNIESAAIKPLVGQIVGIVTATGYEGIWDPWQQSFDQAWASPRVAESLNAVIRNVGQAIGKLQDRDWLQGALDYTRAKNPEKATRVKVFIAHDGPSDLREKLEMECWRSGLDPIIVEEAVSLDESVDAKVERGLDGTEFAIILARLDRGADQDGTKIPRGNVIDEIGRIRNRLGDNYIILLEEGLSLPSNLSTGVVFETFTSDHFDSAILKVYKCLVSKSIL